MRYNIGDVWEVRNPSYPRNDFDIIIIGQGTRPGYKLCQVTYVTPGSFQRVPFKCEYTHAHLKKYAVKRAV